MSKEEVSNRPFKLTFAKCYYCGSKLKLKELEQKAIITYYGRDREVLGKVEAYVCFTCIERLSKEK